MLKRQILNAVNTATFAFEDLIVDAILRVRSASSHVPGTTPTYTSVDHPLSVAIIGYTSKEIDNQRILATDVKGVIFPTATYVAAKPNDLVIMDSGNTYYRVIHNDEYKAGDTTALSVAQLRIVQTGSP